MTEDSEGDMSPAERVLVGECSVHELRDAAEGLSLGGWTGGDSWLLVFGVFRRLRQDINILRKGSVSSKTCLNLHIQERSVGRIPAPDKLRRCQGNCSSGQ